MTSAERYMREQIAQKTGKFAVASDGETRRHLEAMVRRYGSGVLAPVERRCLDRLKGD